MASTNQSTALVHTIIEPKRHSGQFTPGDPRINKGGRPKSKLISEALVQELERIELGNQTVAQKLAKRLIANALYGKPSESTIAIGLTADRTEGKAVQQVRVMTTIDENTAKRLIEMAERLGISG